MTLGSLSCRRASRAVNLSLATCICSVALSFAQLRAVPNDSAKLTDPEVQKLLVAAVQAELSGDMTGYLPLLNAAIHKDPDNKIARWQLGQIQVNGKWLTVEEAQRRAAADPTQNEYQKLRAAAGPNVEDQLVLARWCRKNKLVSESELHWATVLSLDSTNEEAMHALDMRWKDGRLVSRDQTALEKQKAQAAKDAEKHWEPLISKWRRAITGRDIAAHDAALAEIGAIERLDPIPSLEIVTLGREANDPEHAEECLQIAVAFIEALAKMPDQAATMALVRHAVFSPGNKAHGLAIEKLKARPQTDFIPALLGMLAMPIESTYDVRRYSDGSVHYMHSLYREGQQQDWSSSRRFSAMQNDRGEDIGIQATFYARQGKTTVGISPRANPTSNPILRDGISSSYMKRYGKAIATTEANVAATNARSDALNSRVMEVLSGTTAKKLETPRAWWDWWTDENHYERTAERSVDNHYDGRTNEYNYGGPFYAYEVKPSCFAKGTLVWTKSGKRPIEALALGDLILSQDVDTGELNYQPVVYRTIRPPSPMVSIRTDGDEVAATLGHPFWVAGLGWRMAKEIDDGAILHEVSGAARVQSAKPVDDAEAYNLTVANFNTYFVGESGLLVHDNTPRHSARVAVPGIELK